MNFFYQSIWIEIANPLQTLFSGLLDNYLPKTSQMQTNHLKTQKALNVF